jgi:hypothetical protein
MDNQGINFDKFIDEFYSNMNKNKMVLQVDIENATNKSETSIYDIHCMLLDLLAAGITKFNLDFINNLEESICNLQYFFNNINISLNIINFSKKELIMENSLYENRFIKFDDPKNLIINGQHNQVDLLEDIKTFYLINTDVNICISFEHEIIE